MSVDAKIDSLIEALNRNTEALLGAKDAGVAAGAAAPAKTTAAKGAAKTTAAAKTPSLTQDQVIAALTTLKDDFNLDEAKKIVTSVGGVDKMKEIPPEKFQVVYDAATARHAELTAEAAGGGSSGDDL
jgi:hypothetical protein